MTLTVTYHEGGFLPDAPAQNRAEELDGATGVYTAWDEKGTVTEQRPLTKDEAAQVADPAAVPDPLDAVAQAVHAAANMAALKTAVAQLIDTIQQGQA